MPATVNQIERTSPVISACSFFLSFRPSEAFSLSFRESEASREIYFLLHFGAAAASLPFRPALLQPGCFRERLLLVISTGARSAEWRNLFPRVLCARLFCVLYKRPGVAGSRRPALGADFCAGRKGREQEEGKYMIKIVLNA